jgi:hypothetical protein
VARTLLDGRDRAAILHRLGALGPSAQRHWGTMTVGQMVCHLGDVFEAQYDAKGAAFRGTPFFRSFPLKHLALYVLPFPRGVRVTRAVFKTPPGEFARDLARVVEMATAYPERAGRNGWPGHPYFGALDDREWGVFNYKHLDHHLRQFGA